jgi:hypothetical protein
LGWNTLLNCFTLLNSVNPIKISWTKSSIFQISLSKNQARLRIHISHEARIMQEYQFNSSNQARIKQDYSYQKRLNQDRDENFDTKKLEIKNFKQVLLFSVLYRLAILIVIVKLTTGNRMRHLIHHTHIYITYIHILYLRRNAENAWIFYWNCCILRINF